MEAYPPEDVQVLLQLEEELVEAEGLGLEGELVPEEPLSISPTLLSESEVDEALNKELRDKLCRLRRDLKSMTITKEWLEFEMQRIKNGEPEQYIYEEVLRD